MTTADVAIFFDRSPQWVLDLIDDGQLESFRIRGSIWVSRLSVEALLAEQQAAPIHDRGMQQKLRERRRRQTSEKQGPHAVDQLGLLLDET